MYVEMTKTIRKSVGKNYNNRALTWQPMKLYRKIINKIIVFRDVINNITNKLPKKLVKRVNKRPK